MPERRGAGQGGRIKALALGLAIALLLGMSAEIILRVIRPDLKVRSRSTLQFPELFDHLRNVYHETDLTSLWRPQPGYEAGSIRIGTHGFREAVGQSDPETYQVACLGNSVTFGYTTPNFEHTYPAHLETLLERDGCPISLEVLNAGIVGYSSEQGVRLYDTAVKPLSPRVVILLYGYNDHHLSGSTDEEKLAADRTVTRLTSLLQRLHLYRALRKLILGQLPEKELLDATPRVPPSRFRENLERLVRGVRSEGAEPILMTVPIRPEVPLVENPVAIVGRDGTRRWIDQLRWLMTRLPDTTREPITRMMFTNEPLGPAHLQSMEPALESIVREHPNWPLPHYLRGLVMRASGRDSLARRELAASHELDAERKTVSAYNDIIRAVAGAEGIRLVDLERDLVAPGSPERLFHDVVHLTPEGNRQVAVLLRPHVAGILDCQ